MSTHVYSGKQNRNVCDFFVDVRVYAFLIYIFFLDEEGPLDDYCLILLLRGVCYTSLGRNNQAEDCFREIISW